MMKWLHKVLVLCLLVTVSLVINGCAGGASPADLSSDKQSNKLAENNTLPPKNAAQQGTLDKKVSGDTAKVIIYHASKDALYLVPEVHAAPKKTANAEMALELLIAGTANRDLVAVMPQGTKLRSVTVKNHIAYADFNDALVKNGGGSQTELLIVGAIVNTLTEFPDIHKVQILVNGKKINTLSGHLDLSEPCSRFENLLKSNT